MTGEHEMHEMQETQEQETQELETQEQEGEDLELWCLIVGMVGTAFPVTVKANDRVWELQKTIRNEAVEIYGDFNAAQLRVFLARKDDGKWLTTTEVKDIENGNIEPAKPLLDKGHLASMGRLAGIFDSRDTNAVHVLVLAPPTMSEIRIEEETRGKRKRSKQVIGDMEAMVVSTEELKILFDVLEKKELNKDQVIATPSLSEFCQEYGGFPPLYLVRKEELMLWGLVTRMISKESKRIVIVGSAGVGKSCFLMLVSLYTAFVKKRKVLVIRRLRNSSEASAMFFFDGENGTCIRKAGISVAKVSALSDNEDFRGALMFVDGYSCNEADQGLGLFPFQLLSTSVEGKMNFDASTCEMILPGWQYRDLHRYAQSRLDAWKKATGVDQEQHKDISGLVKEQYFYSGGSLRNFCRCREDITNEIDGMCAMVRKMHAVDLEDVDSHRNSLFDRIQRGYVVDPTNEQHYWIHCHWRTLVDSGYAFTRIGRFIDWEKHLDHYEFAHRTKAGFWASIYEQFFHGSVRRSTKKFPLQMVNVVVNSNASCSNQRYDRIEIYGRRIECNGVTNDECFKRLSTLSPRTYWHPDGADFPLVDAVVMCDAVLRGSNVRETILALISTTVSNTKAFNQNVWKKCNKILDDNDKIPRTVPRVFVVVGPDASTCKRFTLIDAPAPDAFVVCCYNPSKFFRKLASVTVAR